MVPTLNILQIVYFVSTTMVLFGGGQTNTNRRVIACAGASPQFEAVASAAPSSASESSTESILVGLSISRELGRD